jgi:hypothetical protein
MVGPWQITTLCFILFLFAWGIIDQNRHSR